MCVLENARNSKTASLQLRKSSDHDVTTSCHLGGKYLLKIFSHVSLDKLCMTLIFILLHCWLVKACVGSHTKTSFLVPKIFILLPLVFKVQQHFMKQSENWNVRVKLINKLELWCSCSWNCSVLIYLCSWSIL